jgi:hypothetical protein
LYGEELQRDERKSCEGLSLEQATRKLNRDVAEMSGAAREVWELVVTYWKEHAKADSGQVEEAWRGLRHNPDAQEEVLRAMVLRNRIYELQWEALGEDVGEAYERMGREDQRLLGGE